MAPLSGSSLGQTGLRRLQGSQQTCAAWRRSLLRPQKQYARSFFFQRRSGNSAALKTGRADLTLTQPSLYRRKGPALAVRPLSALVTAQSSTRPQDKEISDDFQYACPICQETEFSLSASASRCSRTFISRDGYTDLTLSSGVEQKSYQQSFWAGTEIFRSPLISFVYERGWRQGFAAAGFPGVVKETQLALDYLRPAKAKVLLDLSCGSGLFSRRFLQSGQFEKVIASDFSEQMLQQASRFFFEDVKLDRRRFMLMRADAGRLPFKSGSLAAIHAGAAMHCWPNPTAAMAEISRVLRPGGCFVASTFMTIDSPLGQIFGDENIRPISQLARPFNSTTYKWWSEPELRDLMSTVGLQGFQRYRNRQCILFTVRKPMDS